MNLKKLERYLRVNLLGPGPRLIKTKNLPGHGLTKVEKHWSQGSSKPALYHDLVGLLCDHFPLLFRTKIQH